MDLDGERMKNFINFSLNSHGIIFETRFDVLAQLFCTNGNGVRLDANGMLIDVTDPISPSYVPTENDNYNKDPAKCIVYCWSDDDRFQPFRQYRGCQEPGFEEEVEYFVKCIKEAKLSDIQPTEVDIMLGRDEAGHYRKSLSDWKDNIRLVEECLLGVQI